MFGIEKCVILRRTRFSAQHVILVFAHMTYLFIVIHYLCQDFEIKHL